MAAARRGASGPTIAKRVLSRRLRDLRLRTSFTADRVCARLGWGRGKVGRIENNVWKRPEMSDVRDLLRFYLVDDQQRRELEELAMLARQRVWWREYADVFGDSEFPGFEADAARICCYLPLILPGLLQTPAYTHAHMGISVQPPAWRTRAVQARTRRQEILDRDDGTAPQLVAVVTEAALAYQWGTHPQRHAQVLHLLEMASRPHVELRLLRFAHGLHPGMCGPINLFEYAGTEPAAVFLETDFAMQQVEDPPDVEAYLHAFTRLRQAAIDPTATTAHLKHLAATLP